MSRRRIDPPWIPGFWPLMAFLVLIFGVVGYFYLIGRSTAFERKGDRAEAGVTAR